MATAHAATGTVCLDASLQGFTGNKEGQFNRFLEANPEVGSHDAALGKSGMMNDAMRIARDKRIADRSAEITHLNRQIAFVTQREPRVYEWTKDADGNDVKLYKDTPAEQAAAKIKELNAEYERDPKQSWPPNYQTIAREGATKHGAKRMTPIPMDDYAHTLSIKEITDGEWKPAHDELKSVQRANCTTEEGIANLRAEFAAAKERGKVDFSLLAAGGSFDEHGNYRPFVTNARTQLPDQFLNADVSVTVDGKPGGGILTMILPDLWATLAWLDEGPMLAALEAKFTAYNSKFRQIKMADKPKMIAGLNAKLLTASRRLEFACRQREAQGNLTWRPKNVDWRTLLWVEAAPAQATPITSPATGERPAKTKRSAPTVDPVTGMTMPSNPIADDDFDEEDFG